MKERNTLDSEETVKHGGFEEEFQLVLLLLLCYPVSRPEIIQICGVSL